MPGRAVFSVDLRAPTSGARDTAERDFTKTLGEIAARRGVEVEMQVVQRLAPCFCDAQAQALLAEAVAAQGVRPFYLPSGAGHDAMSVAALCKVAMLFIRCRAGISHNPAEHVEAVDAETAAQVMLGFLRRLAEKEAAAF